MHINPLARYGLRVFLLFPFILWLWWVALPTVILPTLEYSSGTIIENIFKQERIEITTTPEKNWLIDTYFLIEEKPYSRTWSTKLDILLYTFGLPLFWCVCLAFFPVVQWKKVMMGTVGILIGIVMCVVFKGMLTIAFLMENEGVQQIYIMKGLYQPVIPFSATALIIIETIASISVYAVTVILPFWFAYYINRHAVYALLFTTVLNEELKSYKPITTAPLSHARS